MLLRSLFASICVGSLLLTGCATQDSAPPGFHESASGQLGPLTKLKSSAKRTWNADGTVTMTGEENMESEGAFAGYTGPDQMDEARDRANGNIDPKAPPPITGSTQLKSSAKRVYENGKVVGRTGVEEMNSTGSIPVYTPPAPPPPPAPAGAGPRR